MIDTKTTRGTPLSIACGSGYLEIVRLLLAHGAAVNRGIKVGENPLVCAAERGFEEIASLLIDAGADLERSAGGWTALTLAVIQGNVGMIKLLLEKGADIDTKDDYGRTPLYLATKRGRVEVVTFLLNSRATIDTRDDLGRTPLMIASEKKTKGIVRLLLESDAKVDIKDTEGRTALCYVAYETYNSIKTLFFEARKLSLKDLKTIEESIEIPSKKPLKAAARSGHAALVDYLLKLQLERKPLADARGELKLLEEKVPNLGGAIYYCLEIMDLRENMRLLVEHGADTGMKDCEGCKMLLQSDTDSSDSDSCSGSVRKKQGRAVGVGC